MAKYLPKPEVTTQRAGNPRRRWAYRGLGCLVLIIAVVGAVFVFNAVSDYGSKFLGYKKVSFLPQEKGRRSSQEVASAIRKVFDRDTPVDPSKDYVFKDNEKMALESAKIANEGKAAMIKYALNCDSTFDRCRIKVTVSGKTVTLTGTVPDSSLIEKATAAVREMEGVDKVVNRLTLAGQ